jgi:hypothetical protein
VCSCLYYAEVKTGLWWLSNFVVLVGSLAYTHIKRQEMKLEFVRQMKASSSAGSVQVTVAADRVPESSFPVSTNEDTAEREISKK